MVVGRFAPSPTGPLHMGSLTTALASFCDIKSQGGKWFVRIDDIDPPRAMAGAERAILAGLEAHGLSGDLPIQRQSEHQAQFESARRQLEPECYYCRCARRSLANSGPYPGNCREFVAYRPDSALRISVDKAERIYEDAYLGTQRYRLDQDCGDFIIWRRDGLVSYQLATAVDDGQGISHVLRGEDLLASTPPQRYLQERLGLTTPTYAHLPVLCHPDGTKLSKQSHAPALDNQRALENLRQALGYLGHPPPSHPFNIADLLSWAVAHWNLNAVPRERAYVGPLQ